MRSRVLLGLLAVTTLTACEGLKEALTAHVDVVAHAASQELTVKRLADLLGNAKIPVPVTRDNVAIVANIWSDYELLGYAAAHGDSLNDKKAIDVALAPIINNMKVGRYMDSVEKTFKADSGNEAEYNQAANGLLAARHILFAFPVPATAAQKDSVRKRAQAIYPQVNASNFVAMVDKYSGDPTAKQNHGYLGVFGKGQMVQPFYAAAAALKPGQVSPLVETSFGYHIIYRPTYAEAKKDFGDQIARSSMSVAESTFIARLDSSAHIQVNEKAPATIKAAAKDQAKYRDDRTTLATYNGGSLTTAQFLGWLETIPQGQQIAQSIPQAPDSMLKPFLRQMTQREVLLHRANDAKVVLDSADQNNLYGEVNKFVLNIWQTIGVDPAQLADSAKSTPEKERLAASRVDGYLDRMLGGQAQAMPVPPPIERLLHAKYESSVNSAGVDRAFQAAQKVRASADSAKAANQPKSQIPLPGMGGPPTGGPPAGAQPQQPQQTPTTPPATTGPKKP